MWATGSFRLCTGSLRFREQPQFPSYMPGVQLANTQPPSVSKLGKGLLPKPHSAMAIEPFLTPALLGGLRHVLFVRGGYVAGNASTYNGNDLFRESGDGVVTVIIQYRLGLFGFLPGEKVKQGKALVCASALVGSERKKDGCLLIVVIQLLSASSITMGAEIGQSSLIQVVIRDTKYWWKPR